MDILLLFIINYYTVKMQIYKKQTGEICHFTGKNCCWKFPFLQDFFLQFSEMWTKTVQSQKKTAHFQETWEKFILYPYIR